MNKIILLALLVFSYLGFAQKQPVYYDAYQPVKRSAVGIVLGPTAFHGDADQTQLGLFGGLFYKYSFSPTFGVKVSGNLGLLKGTREVFSPYKTSSPGSKNDYCLFLSSRNPQFHIHILCPGS